MASIELTHPENVSGNFFVDNSCIDCDTCRWMAPQVFRDIGDQSVVYRQPVSKEEEIKAIEALISCPTASIGMRQKSGEIAAIQDLFPLPVEDNVFHCGYHSKKSFGAAAYLIRRPEGNILVDSPRFAAPLVKKLEAAGGIKYLFLTHQDDVADHDKFHNHFGCERIIHQDDVRSSTAESEIIITGKEAYSLAADLEIIPVPGHTKGHMVLLYQNKFLFTGDHLAWSENLQHLYAFRGACWYSWSELYRSMEKLAGYRFQWVLPGHGRNYRADSPEQMCQEMAKCLSWMQTR